MQLGDRALALACHNLWVPSPLLKKTNKTNKRLGMVHSYNNSIWGPGTGRKRGGWEKGEKRG